ncbi:MAG: Hsp20/alpha crystallin family protein [Methylococcaceae bacterium]|nr:Hsp20/alpha crystallin family protein [Methylococcaceae bacterium]
MNTEENDSKKSEFAPAQSSGGLISPVDLDQFFDDFLSRRWPRLFDWNYPSMTALEKNLPKVDIIDHETELEIQAALPGVKKEDLDVSITHQTITIRTVTKEEKKKEGKFFRREISRGEYQRSLALPDNVDADNAKATFKDGILRVAIPKTEKAKRKSVEVQ